MSATSAARQSRLDRDFQAAVTLVICRIVYHVATYADMRGLAAIASLASLALGIYIICSFVWQIAGWVSDKLTGADR